MKYSVLPALCALTLLVCACSKIPLKPRTGTQTILAPAWQPDLGDGHYKNPVIHADYSDPDAIRVGDTYYMTASSFNSAPGLPLLQSKDMINWELVGHALQQQVPLEVFAKPQHGKGVWAPCLRYHDGKFWIFYPDPDFGIYVITAKDFTGPWSQPHLLLAGKGIIDPTPLWDDDGQAYLLHGWAKSRAGINNLLTLRKMSADASEILDEDGKIVIDGNKIANYKTLEGPKFYKRNGYYYVFAPAGGVETGWQSVFRSRNIYGPYEDRIVMDQGTTPINGPHQGAWVETQDGSDWFFHFQDKRAYGRIVHLQPMTWKNDWPVIGDDPDGDGKGEPVLQWKKPIVGHFALKSPAASDEFSSAKLGLQWQWNANWNSGWYSLGANPGQLRLFTQPDASLRQQHNLWDSPALLLQKLPAEEFVVDTKLDLAKLADGGRAGFIMYGFDYVWLGASRQGGKLKLQLNSCTDAEKQCSEITENTENLSESILYLRMIVSKGGKIQFTWSHDNQTFTPIGREFTAAMGRWVGAQMGLFSLTDESSFQGSVNMVQGSVDVDYFRVSPRTKPGP
jgi:beta-xylosidase